jgi:magnesium-transporting ATPase (P-type)
MTTNHQQTTDDLFATLQTAPTGLSAQEVQKRQQEKGKNVLPKPKRITLFQIIIHQFINPLIYVLIAAGVISAVVGEFLDAGFIFAVLGINALIGTYQEWKAEQNAAALQEFMKVQATVKRKEGIIKIDAENVVVGDIILLESGVKVSADVQLIQTNELTIEEAILTGESTAVHKNEAVLTAENLPLAERVNMAYAGTTVTSGRGTGVVIAIATDTEIGKIADTLNKTEATQMPLVVRMEAFTKRISLVTLLICAMIGLLGWSNGIPLFTIFLFVIALAVSAIPEGLPIAMTVALSIGTLRMAKKNVIIRKLNAVEGLGSCTMIATDKTGTLTADQQTVSKIILATGEQMILKGQGYNGDGSVEFPANEEIVNKAKNLFKNAVFCNEALLTFNNKAWTHHGDAVDVALLAAAYKAQLLPEQLRQEVETLMDIPFESARKYAASFYRYKNSGDILVAVKGATEEILKKCVNIDHSQIEKYVEQLTKEGFRVIAVAQGNLGAENTQPLDQEQIKDLTLLGLVALIDPIRPEVQEAIKNCHEAGIKVAMITGDHPQTAFAIAKQIGIATTDDQIITGKALSQHTDSTSFQQAIKDKTVFARVSPHQKQEIVKALQDSGHFVAVTGDGVNDAPALRTANIGVAMGYGTDIAKDTAAIIITDNNFASIAYGIEAGRLIYSNLRKVIYLLVSTGFAELFTVLLTLIFKLPLPFMAVQLLWLNLVTNGVQHIGLAFESEEQALMKEPPRSPKEPIFNASMIESILLSGLFMSFIVFLTWNYLLNVAQWTEFDARNTCLLLMVLLQNFHVFNCRSEKQSIFKIPLFGNLFLLGGMLAAQGIHILAMHIPFLQTILQVQPIKLQTWLMAFGIASALLVLMELYKLVRYGLKKKQKIA